MKARYDLTNGIIVTGETLEELMINWKNRIDNERNRNRGTGNEFKRLSEIRAERRKGKRVQGKTGTGDYCRAERINWGRLYREI